jgi:hypothetical protein
MRLHRHTVAGGLLNQFVGFFLCVLATCCSHSRVPHADRSVDADTPARPIVGAIRWDGWIGEANGYDVGVQVERSLGPQQWHSRLPFYAQVVSETEVRVRANNQTVMDQEIAYAHAAGLDYWAFVMYASDNPQTRGGLDLYLRSSRRGDIRFAMMVQSYTIGEADIARLAEYFASNSYQTVAGGRPLLFLLGPSQVNDPAWPNVARALDRLRTRTASAGMKRPFIVHLWGWNESKRVIDWLGLDAMGAYSMNFDDRAATYATLARKVEWKWDEWAATGAKVVPLVTAGWDRRPRVEHPVSWEKADPAGAIDAYYDTPTPGELAAHLGAALDWCARHPMVADPSIVLVYAWNEFDEGGWLVPSLWPEQGAARLEAVGRVLRHRRVRRM